MDNLYIGVDKRTLKDMQLRLFGELSNLRADSRSLRRRLRWTREELSEKKYELAAVQDALFRLTVIQFPAPQNIACGESALAAAYPPAPPLRSQLT